MFIIVVTLILTFVILTLWKCCSGFIGTVSYFGWDIVSNEKNLYKTAVKNEQQQIKALFGDQSPTKRNMTRGQFFRYLSKEPIRNTWDTKMYLFSTHGTTEKGEIILGVRYYELITNISSITLLTFVEKDHQ